MSSNRRLTLFANTVALLGGAGIFVLVLMFPWTIALAGPVARESLFALMVVGGTLGFAYGLGFRADTGFFGLVLSPLTVFVVIAAALTWIAYALLVGPEHLL
jgi:predicted membrane protein